MSESDTPILGAADLTAGDDPHAAVVAWVREHTGGTAVSDEFALTDGDLERLVHDARIPDVVGIPPGQPGWVPTWDRDLAAAEGWHLIAARLATTTAASSIGGGREANDWRYMNAIRQAKAYEDRRPPWLIA